MPIRIAIPVPSVDADYNQRSLPPYWDALEASGAVPVTLQLDEREDQLKHLLAGVQGILLPGSRYDVDPERYGERRIPECGEADASRTIVDEILINEAFRLKIPILAICHGAQSLNVRFGGSLVQHLSTQVDHSPGRHIVEAHSVHIEQNSRLAGIVSSGKSADLPVNSSHHQAIRVPGSHLRVVAVSPVDGVIEAVELDSRDHFVLGVQWHPERTYNQSEASRLIFAAFLKEAAKLEPESQRAGDLHGSVQAP